MSDSPEIRNLLTEIRDNQRLSLQRQEEHLTIAREQIERSRNQVEQSLELQRQAIARVRRVSRIVLPGIALCILLIVYMLVKYF